MTVGERQDVWRKQHQQRRHGCEGVGQRLSGGGAELKNQLTLSLSLASSMQGKSGGVPVVLKKNLD